MDKYGLEKIKTVGDAYMCASGLPYPLEDHAVRIVEAAREILEFVEAAKKDSSEDHVRFDIRIGINSGPVVAGVVGTKKFAYDIWGDTVNIAARMESASEEGKINIAENTYDRIKDHFECEARGNIAVKNRGKLNMYYVLSKKHQSQSA
jgi:class 3 adenylate cyclase